MTPWVLIFISGIWGSTARVSNKLRFNFVFRHPDTFSVPLLNPTETCAPGNENQPSVKFFLMRPGEKLKSTDYEIHFFDTYLVTFSSENRCRKRILRGAGFSIAVVTQKIEILHNLVSEILSKNRYRYVSTSKLVISILLTSISNQKFYLFSALDYIGNFLQYCKYHTKFLHNRIFQKYIKKNFIILFHK